MPSSISVAGSNYFISAPWRSSGKTMVTMGLSAIAKDQGLLPQTFKKGPDFIDPMWIGAASGRPCYNLDTRQQSTQEMVALYSKHSQPSSCSLVEGTMGLHDGLEQDGSDSNAAIATLLDLPVILVVDCRGMHRTVAALLLGMEQFDLSVSYAGVILNRLRTPRHSAKIQQAIGAHTDFKILGELPETDAVSIAEQHLGLVSTPDHAQSGQVISSARNLLIDGCDVKNLFGKPNASSGNSKGSLRSAKGSTASNELKIGIARDAAFNFYYQDDLDYFDAAGVELVNVSPLKDSLFKDLDGLIIGGGFPEHHAEELSKNVAFVSALNASIKEGLPVHAECAGLMYLCKALITQDSGRWPMVGIIDAAVTIRAKPVGRGYMQLSRIGAEDEIFWAHEFHHSEIEFDSTPEFVYRVTRGFGVNGREDGVRRFNVFASYAHFRQSQASPWIEWFLSRVREHK